MLIPRPCYPTAPPNQCRCVTRISPSSCECGGVEVMSRARSAPGEEAAASRLLARVAPASLDLRSRSRSHTLRDERVDADGVHLDRLGLSLRQQLSLRLDGDPVAEAA